jgi:hypothetical protein
MVSEKPRMAQVIGGLLILGSTFIGEYIQAGRSHGDVASCER